MATEARDALLAELAAEVGVSSFGKPATHVRIEPERDGSSLIVGYIVDGTTVVRAGKEQRDLVLSLESTDTSMDFEELEAWADSVGWVAFDGGRSHVVDSGDLLRRTPDAVEIVELRPHEAPGDHEAVTALLERSNPDDVDEADIDPDELDKRMFGARTTTGELAGIASSLPWSPGSRFEDIGVLVDSEHRGAGLGAGLVSRISDALFAEGFLPLYRCNWSNEISRGLARSLGFVEVHSLIALCPADDPRASQP